MASLVSFSLPSGSGEGAHCDECDDEVAFLSEFPAAIHEVCEDMARALSFPLTWLPRAVPPADVVGGIFTAPAKLHVATMTACRDCVDAVERTMLLEEFDSLREAVKANWPLGLALILCPVPAPTAHVVTSAFTPANAILVPAAYLIGAGYLQSTRLDLHEAAYDNLSEASEFNKLSAGIMMGVGAAQVALVHFSAQVQLNWCLHPIPAALVASDILIGPVLMWMFSYVGGFSRSRVVTGAACFAANALLLAIACSGVPSIAFRGAVAIGSLVCTCKLKDVLLLRRRDVRERAPPSLMLTHRLKLASDVIVASRTVVLGVATLLASGFSTGWETETGLVVLIAVTQAFGQAGPVYLLTAQPAFIIEASTAVAEQRQRAVRRENLPVLHSSTL
eukprot:TRINITY_DN76458_c0_g1_i1.p1 TRINITY_DN76458_c0_g1~~TRINITY_DN76458_c0_g1_i1.p1  ORF type:complete len:392 (+),score=37.26 TRINITY_DN76458_c0_g1_i1:105-1280(+)